MSDAHETAEYVAARKQIALRASKLLQDRKFGPAIIASMEGRRLALKQGHPDDALGALLFAARAARLATAFPLARRFLRRALRAEPYFGAFRELGRVEMDAASNYEQLGRYGLARRAYLRAAEHFASMAAASSREHLRDPNVDRTADALQMREMAIERARSLEHRMHRRKKRSTKAKARPRKSG